MTEVCPSTNLYIEFKHVISFAHCGFGTERTFAELDVGVGDAGVGFVDSVMCAVVDYLVWGYVEGLVVF